MNSVEFTIEGKKDSKPEDPEDPTTPNNPNEPDTPGINDGNNSNNPNNNNQNSSNAKEENTFDFKLNKYVSKITIKNSSGTQVVTYDKSKLAKVEIEAKKIVGSNVEIEYIIEVTNEGDIPGYASEIVDYMPSGLQFNKNRNRTWIQNNNGELYTTELANQIIEPGETKRVSLTLTKDITQNNIGTITNQAEISKYYNEYRINDIDSTSKNKKNGEDDMSSADVIISIKTGRIIIYTSVIITAILIITIGVYMIKKKVIET